MKRTPLERHTNFKRRAAVLRIAGKSEVSETKRNIQALLREIVIKRDGGCIFWTKMPITSYLYGGTPLCNGYDKNGHLILQADHLITRSNAATYADSRLVVCVCKGHHGWKSLGSNLRKKQYDEIVRQLLPADRVALWDACERDAWRPRRTGAYDWKLAKIALERELAAIQTTTAKEDMEAKAA